VHNTAELIHAKLAHNTSFLEPVHMDNQIMVKVMRMMDTEQTLLPESMTVD